MLAEQNAVEGQNGVDGQCDVEELETPECIRLNAPEFIAELPPDQYRALTEICGGKSVIDAARAARVSRQTLYRWQKSDARFIAALNLWRNQNRLELDAGMSALAGKALAVIASAVDRGNLHAAITVVKHVRDQQVGSGNANLVAEELQYRRKRVTARVYKMRALPEPQSQPAGVTTPPVKSPPAPPAKATAKDTLASIMRDLIAHKAAEAGR